MKYIFVTGGVVSGIGKGTAAASLALLLKARGLKVAILKIDPYLNVDAGTMNPFQHGEVFVTDDGAETDLDLGHYERIVDENLTRLSNFTTGGIYGAVIEKERKGEYLGHTVQVIPHITSEIKRRIRELGKKTKAQILITELGGTVGDIEGLPFLEAIRQMSLDEGKKNVMYIHMTMIAYIYPSDEAKTKPTQQSVSILRSIGIQPDILICRCKRPIAKELKEKIALFTNLSQNQVIEALDCDSIYEIPINLEKNGLAKQVAKYFKFSNKKPALSRWNNLIHTIKNPKGKVTIGMVGKYLEHPDAYISVVEALKHGGLANNVAVKIQPIEPDELQKNGSNLEKLLNGVYGILVPGGFGSRGIEGKIQAISLARRNKIPFLGLCLGLQLAVVEFARNVCNLKNANSTEFDPKTPYPVIDILDSQKGIDRMGGTMRLGAYPCKIAPKTLARRVYKTEIIYERHRHRYEVNPNFHGILRKNGLILSGLSPDKKLVEIVELENHPYFIATQFHPEFKSRPNQPHPLFEAFIRAAKNAIRQRSS
jgi:CTP synthase